MNVEREYLLRVLSDHLARCKSQPGENLDWNKIIDLAKAHEVSCIVYQQCKGWIPDEYKEQFSQQFSSALYMYANRVNALREVQTLFAGNGIESITVKGLEVAGLYPIPALRTMSDLDILVRKQDKERAGQILTQMGYKTEMKNPNYDWGYFRNNMEFELHHQLFYIYDEDINDPEQVKFFNDFWPYVKDGCLDWSFHFLFMLVHLKKHLMLYGAGFRMFFDFAVILKSNLDLEWTWIESKLDEFNLRHFANICFALIELWFGVKAPIAYPELGNDLAERLTDRVARNGIFGFSDKDNHANVVVNAIIKRGSRRWYSRARVVLQNMFPPYSQIAYVKEYRFIEGKPWLLPAAWVFRFFRLATGKTKRASDIAKGIMVSDEKVHRRKEELREWGL